MKIGPLTQTDFSSIKELLEDAGHAYEVFVDENVKADPRLAVPASHQIDLYPTYKGSVAYITVEVPTESLMLLKPELEKMGISIVERDLEINAGPEFHCPKCERTSDHVGRCPEHGLVMVEFEVWVQSKRTRAQGRKKVFAALIILTAGIAALFWAQYF